MVRPSRAHISCRLDSGGFMTRVALEAITAAALLLGGCVGKLETRPDRSFTSPQGALRGVSYALPKVRYEVKLSRALTECPDGVIDGKPTALKFGLSATATPTIVAGESYTVFYDKLAGWLRTANFEMTQYPNGTLKSIGAGAEDKTGEVINSLAKTAFSIASVLALSSGGPPPPVQKPQSIVRCTDAAALMIREMRRIDADLKTATDLLAGYEKDAERLRAAGAARLIDAAGKKRFLDLYDDISKVGAQIDGLKKRQDELGKELGVADDIVWNGGVTAPDYAKRYPLTPAQRSKLAKLLVVSAPPPDYPQDEAEAKRQALMTACYGTGANVDNCLNQQMNVRAGIYLERDLLECGKEGADVVECGKEIQAADSRFQEARDEVPDSGIFVRDPIVGRLLFCRESLLATSAASSDNASSESQGGASQETQAGGVASRSSTQTETGGATGATGTGGGTLEGQGEAPAAQTQAASNPAAPVCTVAEDEAKIAAADFPQFGQLRYFPLRVGTFQAREMALTLSETGRRESFTYNSTKAPAQGLAGTAADIAGQYEAYREKRDTERRADAKADREEEIAGIQQNIDRLTKTAELKKLQDPPSVDPLKAVKDETASVEADLALARAKLQRLQTEAALAEYR